MNKVFLDCGAHCGCSRRLAKILYPDYTIFSFEPDPDFNQYCADLINEAAWISDCEKTFYKFGIDGGSSLSKTRADLFKVRKPNYYEKEEITVKCFDLDRYIRELKADSLILKLDVEGAEYEILNHLLSRGSVSLINKLYIEWHDTRCGYTVQDTEKMIERMYQYNLIPHDWDAMDNKECVINIDPERMQYHAR